MAKADKIRINGITYDLGGGGGNAPTVLWTNTAPSTTFEAQTVTLLDDVANYDFIGIICAVGSNNADNRARMLPIVMVPVSGAMGGSVSLAGYRNYRRNFEISGNKITFGKGAYYATYGTNTTTDSNANLTPRYILGFNYGGIISASATSDDGYDDGTL